jgi:glycosyltransferase involved in cell wall biosynthesis
MNRRALRTANGYLGPWTRPSSPMFSVVIPLFNKAAYIQRALDSVYAQACQPAEILVVNDGSTDGGDAIARAQADPRVRVIDQPNRGVSAARNAGLEGAAEPYVAFLDADDTWAPEFLARMQEAISAHPGAVLFAAGFATVEHGQVKKTIAIPPGVPGPSTARKVDYFAVSTGGHPLHMSTTVVETAAARRVGGFPEGVAFCEDHLFWAKLALAGEVVLTPEILAHYDVAVPGQAVERWKTAYRQQVLEYHRFLAAELHRRLPPANDSFLRHCRREFRVALLQRLYWGDFPALVEFWRELDLDKLPVGPTARACGWLAEHPALHPVAGFFAGIARGLRTGLRTAVR